MLDASQLPRARCSCTVSGTACTTAATVAGARGALTALRLRAAAAATQLLLLAQSTELRCILEFVLHCCLSLPHQTGSCGAATGAYYSVV
eukprot:SAG11_NODE_3388_length_2479_cov_2.572269_1_plen_90_part_00